MFKQKTDNVFDDIKSYEDNEFHTIFCDPPYQLGTKWTIDENGAPVVKGKSKDFMDKWDGFTEKEFEIFFKEAFRVVKFGGYVCMFGMYRQMMALTYYATKHGFEVVEPIHLYFLSSFPKASDLSKNIDKRKGLEREVIGEKINCDGSKSRKTAKLTSASENISGMVDGGNMVTEANSEEAKILEGYKYSVAPLKQALETCFIFKKPNKETVIDDALNCLKGDSDVSISALNIDASRVPTDDKWSGEELTSKNTQMDIFDGGKGLNDCSIEQHTSGRYPSNLIVDENMAKVLDEQSGVLTSGGGLGGAKANEGKFMKGITGTNNFKDLKSSKGGSSKICHKFSFEQEEHDLINYSKKVQKKERNAGVDKNNHPTLKSVQSIEKLVQLFILPKEANQKIYVPFSGVNSEVIGIMKAIQKVLNCTHEEALSHIIACELSEDYVEIGKARLEYWKNHEFSKNKIVEIETELEEDSEVEGF